MYVYLNWSNEDSDAMCSDSKDGSCFKLPVLLVYAKGSLNTSMPPLIGMKGDTSLYPPIANVADSFVYVLNIYMYKHLSNGFYL